MLVSLCNTLVSMSSNGDGSLRPLRVRSVLCRENLHSRFCEIKLDETHDRADTQKVFIDEINGTTPGEQPGVPSVIGPCRKPCLAAAALVRKRASRAAVSSPTLLDEPSIERTESIEHPARPHRSDVRLSALYEAGTVLRCVAYARLLRVVQHWTRPIALPNSI